MEGFSSELLKEDIEILEILESESNREDARDKSNRVDMKVRKGKKATAKIMKQAGEPVEKIMQYTQLTPEEVEAL